MILRVLCVEIHRPYCLPAEGESKDEEAFPNRRPRRYHPVHHRLRRRHHDRLRRQQPHLRQETAYRLRPHLPRPQTPKGGNAGSSMDGLQPQLP